MSTFVDIRVPGHASCAEQRTHRQFAANIGFPWLLLAFLGFWRRKKPMKAKVTRPKAKGRLGFCWLSRLRTIRRKVAP
jgi:hypothetical protein